MTTVASLSRQARRCRQIDRSTPNTARWCAMTTCGSRMKARRYHRRVRTANATNSPDYTGG
ncbi:CGNR zinc finger domain-containing protein [Mycolicibacterium fortuitum]|uniref:CGNR zinc finger domain-containing protein n=1 Tax=Mycolicibacterium fortuitum TaxID=1766 RepID=UPI0027E2E274|nr:CGNR zinc finger domain-containing protein [Mycolicibacterium fortuitum]